MPLGSGILRRLGRNAIQRMRDQPNRDRPFAPVAAAVAKKVADKIDPPKPKSALQQFMDWLLQLIPGIVRALRGK